MLKYHKYIISDEMGEKNSLIYKENHFCVIISASMSHYDVIDVDTWYRVQRVCEEFMYQPLFDIYISYEIIGLSLRCDIFHFHHFE